MKTVDFSEAIAASDFKRMDLMLICHLLTLAQGHVHTKIQTGFFQKLLCRSDLFESFQVYGNENLMT